MALPEVDPNKLYTRAEADAIGEACDHPDVPFELTMSTAREANRWVLSPEGEHLYKLELRPFTPAPPAPPRTGLAQKKADNYQKAYDRTATQTRSAPPPAPPPITLPSGGTRAPQRQWKPGEVDAILAKARLEREGIAVIGTPEGSDLKLFPEQVPKDCSPFYRGQDRDGQPVIEFVPWQAFKV